MEKVGTKQNYHILKTCCISVLLGILLFSQKGYAQYYPAPVPVSPTLKESLLRELKQSTSSRQKIKVLLSLSNLYFNKPIKQADDLDVGLRMANRARDLSVTIHDDADYNNAQYFAANILMLKDDLDGAEKILKDVNDSTK